MFKATRTKSILTMASVPCSPMKNTTLCRIKLNPLMRLSSFSLQEPRASHHFNKERFIRGRISIRESSSFGRSRKEEYGMVRKEVSSIPRSNISSNSDGSGDESSNQAKTPFGYTRKDVLLIGLGVTLLGVGLKSGLEFVGVNELVAGNVVQLVLVLGLTVGWISTYVFRVGNKEMTYAQQLRDYESKVMEKRLESLTEAELQVLIEQVEEEKRILGKGD